MKFFTILVVPEEGNEMRRLRVSLRSILLGIGMGLAVCAISGFIFLDYLRLREVASLVDTVVAENQALQGEAKILEKNLDKTKSSLMQVKDYSKKIQGLMDLAVSKVTRSAGIGPLSKEESKVASQTAAPPAPSVSGIPMGLSIDDLSFKPVLQKAGEVEASATMRSLELQDVLSSLSQRKSLLQSIPTNIPVKGWITSGFGTRVSPFTGKRTPHKGLDVAAPVGTPIYAPANGVVVFSGKKSGYGNFVMVAHGFGIATHYAHCAELLATVGQRVNRGDQIGTVGMTGRTTGPHLHYEVTVNGQKKNPRKFILESPIQSFFANNGSFK